VLLIEMGGSMIGERFVAVSFGESHGKCVGIIVDGCPAGLPLEEADIQPLLDLRKPGQSIQWLYHGGPNMHAYME
jgi:chorismate synthase